jgi:catecholate siderophore receptor
MTNFNGKALRPASLRTVAKGQASTAALGIAVGLSALTMLPAQSLAQEAEQLATVKIQSTAIEANPNAEPDVPYKAKTSGDERRTRPLAETPATITVVTKAQIDDSGYTDLTRILDAQPGITLGTGENGNAFGDRYIIRGQDARSDVFVDGLRDPGMTIRESFAVEQIEITKGPNSSFAGRGTSGGAINAITKQASPFLNFANVQAQVGTSDHVRLQADGNYAFSDTFAIRGNLLYAKEDVPKRSPADRERKGAALSMLLSPTDAFEATFDYYGLRARDNPDLGGYLVNGKPVANVPVYAQKEDFLKSDVDTFTARLKYQFSDNVHLTSLTRYGQSDNGYVATGSRSLTTGANNPGGVYVSGSVSNHQGWQEVRYFANQENLFITSDLGNGRKNELIASFEYTDHSVLNGVYGVTNAGAFNCATGVSTTLNAFCTIGSNGQAVPGLNTLLKKQITRGSWDQDWQVKTISGSIMNTLDITDKLSAFAGLRYDSFDFDLAVRANTGVVSKYPYSDSLWNGHLGLTYKITPDFVAYGAFGSSSDINGGESDVGTSTGYGGAIILNGAISGAKPERSKNYEAGVKWNAMGQRVLLTAALFRIDKSDVHEGDGYTSTGTFNSAKNRVQGLELAASGALTDKLTIQAGFTFQDAEIRKSAQAIKVGKTLSNFADKSGVVQVKYDLTDQFYIGGAVKHESVRYAGQPDTAPGISAATGAYSQPIPSYTVADIFGAYRFNPNLEVRLNVLNVTNEKYYLAAYQSGAFAYKGDPRAVRLTLNYDF